MSYSGTVRCSYCYNSGHNRLGCPDRRKIALEKPESYEGRRWHHEQEARKRAVESRVCSYCKEPKHNRRGCKTLKEDKVLIKKRQEEYLQEFCRAASSVGFGPGSLIKYPTGHRSDDGGQWSKGLVAMVTDIRWSRIDFLLKDLDITREWRMTSKELAGTRIVSTFGYTAADERSYRGIPRHGERAVLKAEQLVGILRPAFSESLGPDELAPHAQLVGPVNQSLSVPGGIELLTYDIAQQFNLDPASNADEWDRKRLTLGSHAWSVARKKEYEEFQSKSV